MSDFLAEMADVSWARVEALRAATSEAALRARALASPVQPLVLDAAFDLIAEVKLTAPSAGVLAAPTDRRGFVVAQASRYARAGAAAISVLTEPTRFDGAMDDLAAVASAVDVPVMRKDFLVHPTQVWEARAAGASGVLLIARMLDDAAMAAMVDASVQAGLFVLLEAFDEVDLTRAAVVARGWPDAGPALLVGVNTRDLSTLQVDPERLASMASRLPSGVRCVAESGLRTAADAATVAGQGYAVALVGSALMAADDPEGLAAAMLAAGRRARA